MVVATPFSVKAEIAPAVATGLSPNAVRLMVLVIPALL